MIKIDYFFISGIGYSIAKMTVTCEICKKEFGRRGDLTRHKNKKEPCVAPQAPAPIPAQVTPPTPQAAPSIKANLTTLFNYCLDVLRDNEHLTGDKALRSIAHLLDLRLLEPQIGKEIDIDNYPYDFTGYPADIRDKHKAKLFNLVRFSNLIKEPEENLPPVMKHLWEDILSVHPVTKNIFIKDGSFGINGQSTYKKLIVKMQNFPFETVEADILGQAYEDVIKDVMTGKILGQYFTPTEVKQMMVKLIDPQLKPDGTIEKIFDPAMGTGGFLITSLRHLLQQSKTKGIPMNWKFISSEGLGGREAEPDTYQLAVSNMLISSGHMFNVLEKGDSIRDPITKKYDIVLANPPFGIKGMKYDDFRSTIRNEYLPIRSDNAVTLFLQAIIYMLKINGRCAIVLPDGQDLFSKTNQTLITMREFLMKTCDLKEVIYLPDNIFTYTSIKTCVLYFVKKVEGNAALEIKVRTSKTQKVIGRDYKFAAVHQTTKVQFYNCDLNKDTKTLLVEVPIKDLANNSYSLKYSEYLKTDEKKYSENIEVKTLGEICNIEIGGTPSRNHKEYYEDGKNLWVSVKELNGHYIYDTVEKITDIGVKNSSVKLFVKDTILFSFKLSIGKVAIVGNPLYTNEAIAGLLSKDNNLLINKYLFYYLSFNDYSHLASGLIGQGSLNKTSLSQIKIPVPPIEQQKAIVEYLDFIYGTIKVYEEEISNAKKLNKDSVDMQSKYGKNEIKTLGEICSFKNGKGLTKELFTTGEYPVVGGGKKPIGLHNEYNMDVNTILCASSGAYAGFISKYNKKVWASDCFGIIPKTDNLNNDYLYYLLLYFQDKIYSMQTGMAQPHVYSRDLQNMKIPVPPIEKQKEIVEYCDFNSALIQQLEKGIELNKKQALNFINMCLNTSAPTPNLQETPTPQEVPDKPESDESDESDGSTEEN